MSPGRASATGRHATSRLRVLTYNIHKGFSASNRRFVLRQMREGIRAVRADLLLLQEVVGHRARRGLRVHSWPEEPQFEFLADEVWPHHAYGRNAVYDAGHHGNAILSRHPIVVSENIDVSAHRAEQRGILHAEVAAPGFKNHLHALCLHLGLLERWRRTQIESLCRRIEEHVPADAPLIVAGDFNDWRGRVTDTLTARLGLTEAFFALKGSHAKTYPNRLPAFALDRVYLRGLVPHNAEALTGPPWNKLSDHIPLLVDFTLESTAR